MQQAGSGSLQLKRIEREAEEPRWQQQGLQLWKWEKTTEAHTAVANQ
jgi:hypothetical protein